MTLPYYPRQMPDIEWRGAFASDELEILHAASFNREPSFDWDWWTQVNQHSLGWVCARGDDTVDFDPHLREFYWNACQFEPTDAGLIAL